MRKRTGRIKTLINWVEAYKDAPCFERYIGNPYPYQWMYPRKRKTWKPLSERLTEELYNDICDIDPEPLKKWKENFIRRVRNC